MARSCGEAMRDSVDDRRGTSPAEADLNRVLRRADWRFLLPSGQPGRLACFADGLLAESAAAVGETRRADLCEDGEADVVVIANGDAATLRAAFRALRPGGSCYAEWTRPPARGWGSVRKRLESAGFVDVACYWPWPHPRRTAPRYWFPLDSGQVLRHFVNTRPRGRTPAERVRQQALRLSWRLAFHTRVLRPVCAVARKPGGENGGDGILAGLHARWEALGLGARPALLSWILFAPGASPINKLVGFVFADDQREPRLVVKLARVRESADALAHEAANLRVVHAQRETGLPGVPSLLFVKRDEPLVVGETYVTGCPLTLLLTRDSYRGLALKVTRWLGELGSSSERAPRTEWWGRLVGRPLTELDRVCGSLLNEGELSRLGGLLGELTDLPLVVEQRDCAPWNISLAADGTVVVHDWESAEPRGLPLLDLTYFLAYSAFFLDGAFATGRFTESYRRSLDTQTLTGRVTAECEAFYLARVALEPSVVPAARALTWLVHVHSECLRLGRAAAERGVFLSLLREEIHSA